MLSEEKEQKLVNTNVIAGHNTIAVSSGQQLWRSSFCLIQTCSQLEESKN